MSKAHNLFETLQSFDLGNGANGAFYSLPQLEKAGLGPVSKLPVSIRLVLESVLRNRERYQFLKWGMQAFDTFKVVPPGIGIVHQVNLEYLAKGVLANPSHNGAPATTVYFPDTLVGTDSHTTMINGLGIVGWGVG